MVARRFFCTASLYSAGIGIGLTRQNTDEFQSKIARLYPLLAGDKNGGEMYSCEI